MLADECREEEHETPPAGKAPPKAALALETPDAKAGGELTLGGGGSQRGSGRIISYDWDLGGNNDASFIESRQKPTGMPASALSRAVSEAQRLDLTPRATPLLRLNCGSVGEPSVSAALRPLRKRGASQ